MAPKPRGRGRKRTCTDSRLHAALDAMRPYGFCQDLVQLTLGEVLNVDILFVLLFYVYGGDDGWEFIEEGCYSLLLETILEKINAPQKKGCDGSILLDARDGEKISISNNNSARGFEVVDDIKSAVERECPAVVSCADILAIAARDPVVIKRWICVNRTAADDGLPSAFESLENITKKYAKVGLNITDVVSSSGSHTIGLARCAAFSNRLYNFSGTCRPDSSMDEDQLFRLQKLCPMNGDEMKTTLLDQDSENEGYINIFGNHYFQNLLNRKSVLSSDQVLSSSIDTKSLVELYSKNNDRFFSDFVNSMIKMGNISPPSGSRVEIRRNCRRAN
uniref:Peroxidase n=1 Tax=Fagus sylvatica TaxID=28930 RepID=A0A2N9J2U6_FAGSY